MLAVPVPFEQEKSGRGFGGNSTFLLPNQNEASPATLQFIARHHRKILFSLGEKEIRRAQDEKSKEYFSVVWRAKRVVAGLASLVGVLLKECSNFVQKTPQVQKESILNVLFLYLTRRIRMGKGSGKRESSRGGSY